MSRRLTGFKAGGLKVHPGPDKDARVKRPVNRAQPNQNPLWPSSFRRLATSGGGSPAATSGTAGGRPSTAENGGGSPQIARLSTGVPSSPASMASPPTPTHGGKSPPTPDSVLEFPSPKFPDTLTEATAAGGQRVGTPTNQRSSALTTPPRGGALTTPKKKHGYGTSSSLSSLPSSATSSSASSSSRTPKTPLARGGSSTLQTATPSPLALSPALGSPKATPKALPPAKLPKLKVVLDMDECLIHSIFSEGVAPGRVAFGRPSAPPPSPPPFNINGGIESFPLTMLDKACCTVNKRPRVDWFLEQVSSRFDTYVMTAGTRDYAEPLLDVLDKNRVLKGRFYRDSCVFHEGHYFKDLRLVDEDPRRVVLVDNNPASFVLCPANGIPVPSFYDDPGDRGLEAALKVLLQIEDVKDVRRTLRQLYGLEAKLAPLTRQFNRSSRF